MALIMPSTFDAAATLAGCLADVRLQRDDVLQSSPRTCAGVLKDLRIHTLFTSIVSTPNFGMCLGNCVTLWFFGAECLGEYRTGCQ